MQYKKDLSSPHRELFLNVRQLILSFDGVIEEKKERITTYSFNGRGVCHVRTMPYGVDIGFLRGVLLFDPEKHLVGSSKRIRVLPMKTLDSAVLGRFIDQALQLNTF